jgi:Rha family phage regulatory protein
MFDQLSFLPPPEDVYPRRGDAWTNSLRLAARFNKHHRTVLGKIDNILREQIPADRSEFGLHNFVQSSYVNEQNRRMPLYELTLEGFMFVSMSFTGADAARWKIDLIKALVSLREMLRAHAAGDLVARTADTTIMLHDTSELVARIDGLGDRIGGLNDQIIDTRQMLLSGFEAVVQAHCPRLNLYGKDEYPLDQTCIRRYDGYCPFCGARRIYDEHGLKIPGVHSYHHQHGRNKRDPRDCAPCCKPCNQAMEDPELRIANYDRFKTFQHNMWLEFRQFGFAS